MADMTELTENQKKLEEAFKKSQDSKTTAEAETARLNQVSQDAYKQTKLENEQAQNQYAQNISANQLTALDAIRRSNASAIASGANAGLSAANQLSSILGLQQDTTQEATDLANTAVDNAAQLNTQLNENAVTGAQTANEINAALGANEAELAKAMASNSAAIADIQAAEIAAKSQEKIAGLTDITTTTTTTDSENNKTTKTETTQAKSTAQQQLEAEQREANYNRATNSLANITTGWNADSKDNHTYATKYWDPFANNGVGAFVEPGNESFRKSKVEAMAAKIQAELNKAYSSGDAAEITKWTDHATKFATTLESVDDGCLAPGTKITLADGSFKNVEDITNEDELLVWDMFIGNWSTAPILFVEHDEEIERDVITLNFAGSVTLDIIDDHGLFDLTLGRYVYIHSLEEAQSYVGHEFFYTEDKGIIGAILLGATVSRKKITAHSPCTARALCVIANGMLTMPGNTEPFTNVCKMSDYNICYDIKDLRDNIDKYGLFSEKDFEGILPSNIFFAFQGPLLKIKIGRGETSMEEIHKLITRYSKYLV